MIFAESAIRDSFVSIRGYSVFGSNPRLGKQFQREKPTESSMIGPLMSFRSLGIPLCSVASSESEFRRLYLSSFPVEKHTPFLNALLADLLAALSPFLQCAQAAEIKMEDASIERVNRCFQKAATCHLEKLYPSSVSAASARTYLKPVRPSTSSSPNTESSRPPEYSTPDAKREKSARPLHGIRLYCKEKRTLRYADGLCRLHRLARVDSAGDAYI